MTSSFSGADPRPPANPEEAATGANGRATYVAPTLRIHGDVTALTRRNFWAPGRQDGSNWFRRTG